MFWRVYNTLQDDEVSQDELAAPLGASRPCRQSVVRRAVTSEQLLDTTVSWGGRPLAVTEETLPDLVERQLPPAGKARGYDASVLDWERVGRLYLNEPEDEAARPSGLSEPGTAAALLLRSAHRQAGVPVSETARRQAAAVRAGSRPRPLPKPRVTGTRSSRARRERPGQPVSIGYQAGGASPPRHQRTYSPERTGRPDRPGRPAIRPERGRGEGAGRQRLQGPIGHSRQRG